MEPRRKRHVRICGTRLGSFFIKAGSTALILAVTYWSGTAQAQENGRTFDVGKRSVTGVVTDPDGKAAAGAVVLLKDTKTLQVRSFLTKEDGAYRFFGLSMNDQYELRAQKDQASSGSKTLSQFDNRKEAKIDLKLK